MPLLTRRPSGTTRPPDREAVPASKAKAHLLELLKDIDTTGRTYTITRRGRAIARLVPIQARPQKSLFGFMQGTGRITGDVLEPEPETWEALSR